MAKQKVIVEPYEDTKKWLCTFNDLMTLLLTFFVLLLSMSSLDEKKIIEMQSYLIDALGVMEEGRQNEETIIEKIFSLEEIGKRLKVFKNLFQHVDEGSEIHEIEEPDKPVDDLFEKFILLQKEGPEHKSVKLEELQTRFRELLQRDYDEPGITVLKEKRGIVLRLKNSILFDSGQALLKPAARIMLADVSGILQGIDYFIYVEGHTDSRRVQSGRFPSNWELSVARAVSVADEFITEHAIPPERIGISGYGATNPVVPNTTQANMSQNRRIEIIISKF